jgi:hypothetical protein
MTEPMKLWRFEDAPPFFKHLSTNGGDEDWVLLVPPGVDVPFWVEINGAGHFGACCTDRYVMADGSEVFIGSHA